MGAQSEYDARQDKRLGVSTGADRYEKDDPNHSRYEPTAYRVLERLAESGWIEKGDVLADYGCGRGRVSFCLHHALGVSTVGIEYNRALYEEALGNLAGYQGRRHGADGIRFVCTNAEEYRTEEENCFYFFNPFSVKLLQAVVRRIFDSYYACPRPMKLFFYYALDSYREYLMTEEGLDYAGEIDMRDLFGGEDEKEKILIFTVG